MTNKWVEGHNAGQQSVLEFLEEMKGLDLRDEYNAWANADEYQNINGETIKRYA